jgi:hypothetical protein
MGPLNNIDLELAFGQALNLDAMQIFQSLMLALVLGIVVALVYRVSVSHEVISPAMLSSLVILAVIGSMVMMVIGNNIARAFSLVGALAIIRFRTRLRSPWDITFVFFSLAVGIACGVFAYRVAVLGSLVISLAVLALYVLPLGGTRGPLHLLRCDIAAYQGTEKAILAVLTVYLRKRALVEARSLRFGETLSYRYRVALKREDQLEELLRALSDVEGVERVIIDADDEAAGQTD